MVINSIMRERGTEEKTYKRTTKVRYILYLLSTMNSTGGLSIPFLLIESLAIIVYEYLTPWTKLLIT